MNKNKLKWIGVVIISTLFLCMDIYAAPVINNTTNAGTMINLPQAHTLPDTSGMHKKYSKHEKIMNMKMEKKTNKKIVSTSKMHNKSAKMDTSMVHKRKRISMMRPPKNESQFISEMTHYLNSRVRLNPDQTAKVHQALTDYYSVARSDIKDVNNTASTSGINENGRIFAGTHNPVDTNTYISPYASLNSSAGITTLYGNTTGTDSNAMLNQSAGAKTYIGSDSTKQNNLVGKTENETSNQNNSGTALSMNSGTVSMEEKAVELDQAGIKVEKQIESILTDKQETRFASIKDHYINLVRQQALSVKSE